MKRSDARAQLTHAADNSNLESQRPPSSSSSSSSQSQSQSGLHITEREPDLPLTNSDVAHSSSRVPAQLQEHRETAGTSGVQRRADKRKHEDSEEESSHRSKKQTPRGSQDKTNPALINNRKPVSQNHGGKADADAKVPQLQRAVASISKNPFVFSSHVVVPETRKSKKSAQGIHPSTAQSVVQNESKRQTKTATATSHQPAVQSRSVGAAEITGPSMSISSARYQRELEERLTQRAASSSRAQTRARVERSIPTRVPVQDPAGVQSRHGFIQNQQRTPLPRNIRGQLTRSSSGEHIRSLTPSESVRNAFSHQRTMLTNHENSLLLSHSPAASCSSTLLQLPSDGLFPLYPLGQPDDPTFRSPLELSTTLSQFTQENLFTYPSFHSSSESLVSQDNYPAASVPSNRKSSRSSGETSSEIVVPPSSVGIKRAGPYLLGI